jgi:cyclase
MIRHIYTTVIILLTSLLANQLAIGQPALRHEQEDVAGGPMKVERVKDGLYLIRGPFTPCMFNVCTPGGRQYADDLNHESGDIAVRVTPEGLIVVDSKFNALVPDALALIRTISPLPIKYVLNTHHHPDHAQGNGVLATTGLDIVGHRNARNNFLRIGQSGEPNIVFDREASVFLGGVEVRLLHVGRGHTDGDSVIYFPDLRTVHTGDLIIDGMPFIDYSSGGSAVEWVQTIDALLEIDFDTVIPGHGWLMDREDVIAYKYRFEEMNRRMRELAQGRVPIENVVDALNLEELGWDNTVSTSTWLNNSLVPYYEEMANL